MYLYKTENIKSLIKIHLRLHFGWVITLDDVTFRFTTGFVLKNKKTVNVKGINLLSIILYIIRIANYFLHVLQHNDTYHR